MIRTIEWKKGRLALLDQRLLPARELYRSYADPVAVAGAIRSMVVRGAPAIGVAAAFGVVLAVRRASARDLERGFERAVAALAAARPTAVNLAWALERMRRVFAAHRSRPLAELRRRMLEEALAIQREDVAANRALGRHGARLLPARATVLTYCNAGALATAGYGTALGIVRAARESGKRISVLACETRPFLQGARLTAWELVRDRIPCTLVTDNMAGHLMQRGGIDAVVVGTDRTARNGDVANKIGTYTLAVLARRHGIPFYVAAPSSSIDLAMPNGGRIPIEERPAAEVTHVAGKRVAPKGVAVRNPAFDVTPAPLVTAIITERGVARPPYRRSLARLARVRGRPSRPGSSRATRARARHARRSSARAGGGG